MTQIRIVGFIGITEVVLFFLAPFVFIKNQKLLRRHGFMRVLVLAVLWVCSALITDWYRQNTFENLLKGVAVPYAVFAGIVCMHALLWDDLKRFKWAVIGMALSTVLSIYVFPTGTSVGMGEKLGLTAEEAFKEYKLFGVIIAGTFLTLPIKVFYLKISKYVSAGLLILLAAYSLYEGGISVFLVRLISAWIVFWGGRKIQTMKTIHRHFIPVTLSLVVIMVLATQLYKGLAREGVLGDEELLKYEQQSSSRIGLLSGRSEFISALWAIKDSPLIGHGAWAIDYRGYLLRTVELIGTPEDVEILMNRYASGHYPLIPCHSYVWQSWVYNGAAGGMFWIYIFFFVFVKTFRSYMGVAPHLFGYFAISLPVEFWNVWFSPLGQRLEVSMLIVLCLLVMKLGQARKNPLDLQKHGGLPAQ